MKLIKKKEGYQWNYCSIGGVVRVKIGTGEDIAHLGELDQKMWTVLSCPTGNLEFDAKTLAFLDSDSDGKIKVPEVIAAAKWLTSAVKDKDGILKGEAEFPMDGFNEATPEGQALKECATKILKNLKSDKTSISLAEVSAYSACQAEADIDKDKVFPYGDNTEAALAACNALDAKITDYFTRCKLLAYDAGTAAAVEVKADKIEDLASCVLALPNADGILPLTGINPAWADCFNTVKTLVFDVALKGKDGVSEADWKEVLASFGPFKSWQADKNQFINDQSIVEVDKFLHLYRDFYRFLNNYVIFNDFYSLNPAEKAIFEAGELYIDQRCCHLCIRVTDMAKHADMAGLSGMFLIYCTCTSKVKGATMDIVAVMTEGDIKNIRPGKNAIFYDRNGLDWDATVTKIVDNPISIRQAFWSPYRKLANFINEKIDKSASEKDSAAVGNLLNKADNVDLAKGDPKAAKPAFDIAKFAGIFAAIGMAFGYIGALLKDVVSGVKGTPFWQTLLIVAGLMLVISGPACFIAWRKLRKRNLGPVLNAGGWAINSVVLVNILFGETLTSLAKYPHLNLKDPYKKETPKWKKALVFVVIALVAAAVAYLWYTGKFACILG